MYVLHCLLLKVIIAWSFWSWYFSDCSVQYKRISSPFRFRWLTWHSEYTVLSFRQGFTTESITGEFLNKTLLSMKAIILYYLLHTFEIVKHDGFFLWVAPKVFRLWKLKRRSIIFRVWCNVTRFFTSWLLKRDGKNSVLKLKDFIFDFPSSFFDKVWIFIYFIGLIHFNFTTPLATDHLIGEEFAVLIGVSKIKKNGYCYTKNTSWVFQ